MTNTELEKLKVGDVIKCCKAFGGIHLNEMFTIENIDQYKDYHLKDFPDFDYPLIWCSQDNIKDNFYYMGEMSKNTNQEEIQEDKIEESRVNHPKYYNMHPSGIECIDIIRHYCFDIGNAIKYLWRAGLKKEQGLSDKEKEIEDLEKAVFYINDWINHLKSLLCGSKN